LRVHGCERAAATGIDAIAGASVGLAVFGHHHPTEEPIADMASSAKAGVTFSLGAKPDGGTYHSDGAR